MKKMNIKNPELQPIFDRQERLKKAYLAGIGQVGIWWIWKNEVLQDSVPWTEGDNYGDFVHGNSDHFTFWPKFQKLYPELKNFAYNKVMRGRVAYDKIKQKFIVFGSHKFVSDPKLKSKILKEFGLSVANVIFKDDEHYELNTKYNDFEMEDFDDFD